MEQNAQNNEDASLIRILFDDLFETSKKFIDKTPSNDEQHTPEIGGHISFTWEDFANGKRTRLWDAD